MARVLSAVGADRSVSQITDPNQPSVAGAEPTARISAAGDCSAARIGAILFRHRGWLPLIFLGIPLVARGSTSPFRWEIGLALIVIGEAVRLAGVAAAGSVTRRRSRNVQRLVTYGIFAWCRNPLYVGNFLIWMGFVTISGVLVFRREQQDGDGQEPEHARDGDESHPDEEVADVERITAPGEDPVGNQSLDIARAAARCASRGSYPRETHCFADYYERQSDLPPGRRGGPRRHQRDAEEDQWKPAAMTKKYCPNARRRRLLGGADPGGRLRARDGRLVGVRDLTH